MGCTCAVYSGSPLSGSVASRLAFDCRMLSFESLLFAVFVERIHDIVKALVYEIAVAPHILGQAASTALLAEKNRRAFRSGQSLSRSNLFRLLPPRRRQRLRTTCLTRLIQGTNDYICIAVCMAYHKHYLPNLKAR